VTTPDERLEELRSRALAADIAPVSDPEELAELSIRTLLDNVGGVIRPNHPEVNVRLHGPRVPAHDVPVREAAAILNSVQEAVASIGQALTHEPTTRGAIQANVLRATELRLSSSVGAGSVIFRLAGPSGDVLGDETALTGTLVDRALGELFSLVEQSEADDLETSTLAQELRGLGPRVAKHLSDLVKQVVEDEIDVDFTWRSSEARARQVSLQRRSALAIRDAIERNKVETKLVELKGILITVSRVTNAELLTDDEGRVRLSVSDEQAGMLGPFYNQRVTVIAEQTTTWSTNTGQEKRKFRLIELRLAEDGQSPPGGVSG